MWNVITRRELAPGDIYLTSVALDPGRDPSALVVSTDETGFFLIVGNELYRFNFTVGIMNYSTANVLNLILDD